MSDCSTAQFREVLSQWLAETAGTEIATGLSRQDAAVRAEELHRTMAVGGTPSVSVLDEEAKDVLFALVERVERNSDMDPQQTLRIADGAYRIIHSEQWPNDTFAEKRGLLERCARTGWGAVGYSLEEVATIRAAAGLTVVFDVRPSSDWRRIPYAASQEGCPESLEDICTGWETDASDRSLRAVLISLFACTQSSPDRVAFWASRVHERLSGSDRRVGVFDEHEYFLGVVACLASDAARYLGEQQAGSRWLREAAAAFRCTLTPELLLLKTECEDLVVELSGRHVQDVAVRAPEIIRRCDELGLKRDALKGRIAEAVALKDMGRYREAEQRLAEVMRRSDLAAQPALHLMAVMTHAEVLSVLGRHDEANALFSEAERKADAKQWPALSAHLHGLFGESHRDRGHLRTAILHYRTAVETYNRAGMPAWAAYGRILLAEALLMDSRNQEAELEILSAIPVIEEKKLVQEGVAALALLRESIRRRQTDRNALRQLREHLKKKI